MRWPDVEHQADLRPSHPHEMGDVTRLCGAHLQDEVTGLPVSAQDGQREPYLVVKGTRGGDGRRLALEDLGEQVLGRGLADRPGEPDDDGVQPVPDESGQFGQRGDHVVRYHARPVDGAGAQHRDGASGVRRGREVVAVAARSRDGREQGASRDLAGVDDHRAGDGEPGAGGPVHRPVHGPGDLLQRQGDHRAPLDGELGAAGAVTSARVPGEGEADEAVE